MSSRVQTRRTLAASGLGKVGAASAILAVWRSPDTCRRES